MKASFKNSLLLIMIIAISFFLRVYNLEGYPSWYWDEGINAHLGLNMLDGVMGYNAWHPNFFPPLFDAMQGIAILAFGNSYFSVRLVGVLLNVLSIMLLWIISKRTFRSDRYALTSTLLFALTSSHIGRMGLQYNGAIFFFLLVVYTYKKAIETNNNIKFYVAVGFFAALSILSHFGGIIAWIYIIISVLWQRKLKELTFIVIGAIPLLMLWISASMCISWQWFVYDIFQQAKRPFQLVQTLNILFLSNPVGFPVEGFVEVYSFTLIGALAAFYILIKNKNKELCILIISTFVCIILMRQAWWAYTAFLWPVYAITFTYLLHEIRHISLRLSFFVCLILPAIAEEMLYVGYDLEFTGFAVLLILLSSITIENIVVFPNKCFIKRALPFLILLPYLLNFATIDFPILFTDMNYDNRTLVSFINDYTNASDYVAVPPNLLPLVKAKAVDTAHLAFAIGKKPHFLFENAEVMLSRFRPEYCNIDNYKIIVLDGWERTNYDALLNFLLSKHDWAFISYREFMIFIKSPVLANYLIKKGDILLYNNFTVNIAYYLGAEVDSQSISGDVIKLSARPTSTFGWAFWEFNFSESIDAKNGLLMLFRASGSDKNIFFTIKLIDNNGNEVLPWFVTNDLRSDFNTYYYILQPRNVTINKAIIGFHWNLFEVNEMTLEHDVQVDYIIISKQLEVLP
ncbi:MAG: glycosyltransferase family 39 protein [Candidatus Bathyarchaeia archaeon]